MRQLRPFRDADDPTISGGPSISSDLTTPDPMCKCGKPESKHGRHGCSFVPASLTWSDADGPLIAAPLSSSSSPVPTNIIKAPFSLGHVVALNRYQRDGRFHPFTCGNDRGNAAHREYQRQHGGDFGQLVATTEGWVCPVCDYTQDWAHASVAPEAVPTPSTPSTALIADAPEKTEAMFVQQIRATKRDGGKQVTMPLDFAESLASSLSAARRKLTLAEIAITTAEMGLEAQREALETTASRLAQLRGEFLAYGTGHGDDCPSDDVEEGCNCSAKYVRRWLQLLESQSVSPLTPTPEET